MNLAKLIKDKRVIIGGVAIAALLGVYTLYNRTKGGAGVGGDDGESSSSAGSPGQLGGSFPDTTGSNVASWFGQYSESVQRQLDQYRKEQLDAIAALGNVPTSPSPERSYPGNRKVPPGGGNTGPRKPDELVVVPQRR